MFRINKSQILHEYDMVKTTMQHIFSVIIPVYNGAHLVEDCLNQLLEVSQKIFSKIERIIIVNDGSETWNLQEETLKDFYRGYFELIFIHHAHNKGKGAAVKSGLKEGGECHSLMLDVDGATQTESIIQMIKESEAHPSRMICGSRYSKGSKILKSQKKWRTRAGYAGSLVTHGLFSLPIQDTQCGAKVFPPKLIKIIIQKGKSNRWVADVEWLLLAQKESIRIMTCPVVWKDGKESQVKLRHFIITAWDIFMIKMRSF